MNHIPDKQRVRDLLHNWRKWSICPPDPAEIYFYTESPMFNSDCIRQIQEDADKSRDDIVGLWEADSLFSNKEPAGKVRIMTAKEYEDETR